MAVRKVRVHNLAKTLGVSSKAIIEKCRSEGIEVENHMHVVSAGLEASIREWFTAGAHHSAVEESKPVDLEKVKVKRKSSKKTKAGADDQEGGVAVLEAPAEAPPEAPRPRLAPARKQESLEPAPAVESEVEISAPESAPGVPAATPESAPPAPALAPAAEAPSVEPGAETPTAPTAPPEKSPAKPVAAPPQNVPTPAKLSGPKLVRMDRPETVDRPRPSARPPLRPPLPLGPAAKTGADDDETRPGGRGAGKAKERTGDTAERVHPRRSIRDVREEVNEKLREWRDRDLIERKDRLAHASGRGIGGLRAIEGLQTARRAGPRTVRPAERKDKVELTEPIVIKDFSRETGVPVAEIVRKLMQEHEQLATINSTISMELAQLFALEYGIELTVVKAKSALEKIREEHEALPRNDLKARPPVVTVLGHVDHGKTSLLDRVRKANVAAGEAGGITQHIGAYRAKVDDRWVTFLDTPGHAAFTAMRARGAHMTDVVVLVVAADDGVMPTTIEAINHAKAAGTTVVVALNKIDLPHDINKIFGQLTEHGLTPSGDWGGDTDVIQTSASTGQGVDDLLAHLATLSDVLDLKADASLPACGTVIEAQRTEGQGNVAHLLVQEGTLRAGDFIVCGPAFGRVRAMRDDRNRNLKQAGPSTPVEVTGLSDVPLAGDRFYVVNDLQRARQVAADEAELRRQANLIRAAKPTNLESLLAEAQEGDVPVLPVIVKADVQGSVDVLVKALSEFPDDQVRLQVLHAGVGAPTESDMVLAQASKAIIISFYVVPDGDLAAKAENLGVNIRSYRVIYDVLDDIKKALEGLLTPDEKIESRGRAEVREVFSISRVGRIAGCYVRDGSISRSNLVRVIRDGVAIKDSMGIASLRRFKDDVKEVKNGLECGIRIEGFDDLKPGDVIEAFEVIKVARKLEG